MRRLHQRLAVLGIGVGLLATTVTATASAHRAPGRTPDSGVVAWIDRNAAALASTDPAEPLTDLRPLRRTVGQATVVGLGEAAHGSRELFRVKHRMVRFLVERMGFRTVAFEEDFAGGVVLDRYVLTGQGDPRALVADMTTRFWNTEEILDLVRWMRAYNETHEHKVRFLGTDILALRPASFDAIRDHVRRAAPERLAELERHLRPIYPTGSRQEHMNSYFELTDEERQRQIDHAREVYELVRGLPHEKSLEREYAEQHARAIIGWHIEYARGSEFSSRERERAIADTIAWWQRVVGGKIAYWAANAHTTSAPTMTFRSGGETTSGVWAGGHLRERLGRRYLSIGTSFWEGALTSNYLQPGPYPVGPPSEGLLEATLGQARIPDYLLDLRAPAFGSVRRWLQTPVTLRMIDPGYAGDDDGSAYTMTMDSLAESFDALVFVRTTSPSRLLPVG